MFSNKFCVIRIHVIDINNKPLIIKLYKYNKFISIIFFKICILMVTLILFRMWVPIN